MKKALLPILLHFPFISLAQDVLVMPENDGKIIYELVLDVPQKNKTEIYSTAKAWYSSSFENSKDVLDNADPEGGKLMGKGTFTKFLSAGIISSTYTYQFKIDVDIKDQKCRLRVYDIIASLSPIEKWYQIYIEKKSGKKISYQVCNYANDRIKALVTNFKSSMVKIEDF